MGRLLAVVLLAALTIGVPAALVMIIGLPVPKSMPSMSVLTGQLDVLTILKILSVVVWLAWLQLVWCVIVEIRAAARNDKKTLPDDTTMTAHVGIGNINQRMRSVYGETYALEVETAPGAGMKVILRVPSFQNAFFSPTNPIFSLVFGVNGVRLVTIR